MKNVQLREQIILLFQEKWVSIISLFKALDEDKRAFKTKNLQAGEKMFNL